MLLRCVRGKFRRIRKQIISSFRFATPPFFQHVYIKLDNSSDGKSGNNFIRHKTQPVKAQVNKLEFVYNCEKCVSITITNAQPYEFAGEVNQLEGRCRNLTHICLLRKQNALHLRSIQICINEALFPWGVACWRESERRDSINWPQRWRGHSSIVEIEDASDILAFAATIWICVKIRRKQKWLRLN